MSSCRDLQELLGLYLDGEMEPRQAERVAKHLTACDECAATVDTLKLIHSTVRPFADLVPPAHLEHELVMNPCRRWLGLLFAAVDRDISDHNVARLLTHLESCGSCRQTWNDLTLIHQVGDRLQPPPDLLGRCIAARQRRRPQRILGRKTVIAAAYLLAVLIGPPVTLARHEAADVVQRVASTVSSEVSEVADSGRGELRVMVWRSWQWGIRQLGGVREFLTNSLDNKDTDPEQGGSNGKQRRY